MGGTFSRRNGDVGMTATDARTGYISVVRPMTHSSRTIPPCILQLDPTKPMMDFLPLVPEGSSLPEQGSQIMHAIQANTTETVHWVASSDDHSFTRAITTFERVSETTTRVTVATSTSFDIPIAALFEGIKFATMDPPGCKPTSSRLTCHTGVQPMSRSVSPSPEWDRLRVEYHAHDMCMLINVRPADIFSTATSFLELGENIRTLFARTRCPSINMLTLETNNTRLVDLPPIPEDCFTVFYQGVSQVLPSVLPDGMTPFSGMKCNMLNAYADHSQFSLCVHPQYAALPQGVVYIRYRVSDGRGRKIRNLEGTAYVSLLAPPSGKGDPDDALRIKWDVIKAARGQYTPDMASLTTTDLFKASWSLYFQTKVLCSSGVDVLQFGAYAQLKMAEKWSNFADLCIHVDV